MIFYSNSYLIKYMIQNALISYNRGDEYSHLNQKIKTPNLKVN